MNQALRPYKSSSQSHEIDFSYDDGRLSNILGATYFHMSDENRDIYNLPAIGLVYLPEIFQPLKVRTKAWGVFDQLTYKLTDQFRVIGGIRYSNERQSNDGVLSAFCPITAFPSNLPLNQLRDSVTNLYGSGNFASQGCFSASQPSESGGWSNVNWKAGVQYDIAPAVMGYATATTGFKSGGFSSGTNIPLSDVEYKPEKVVNIEGGIKGRFFDNALSISAAIYYEHYTNMQVTQIVGITAVTKNAAAARIYGLELEGGWQPTSSDCLTAFINYTNAKFQTYNNAVDQQLGVIFPSLSGSYLPRAPLWSGRIEYGHDFKLANGGKLTPSASIYFQSRNYLREFNLPIDRVPGYSKSNARIAYTDPSGSWNIQGFINNIENRRIRSNSFTLIGGYYSDYAPPRTYGMRLSYKY